MPKTGRAYPLQFGRVGMLAHANRWLANADELVVAKNVTFENDLVQKENVSAHYDQGGLAIEAPGGTFASARDYQIAAAWLPASGGTPAYAGQVFAGTFTLGTATASFTVNLGALSVGQTMVVAIGREEINPASPIASSVTDTQGNTYTRLVSATAGSITASVELWATRATTALTGSDSVVVTWTAATLGVLRAAAGARYNNAAASTDVSNWTGGATATTNFDVSQARAASSYPAVLVAAVNMGLAATGTVTWDSGWTERVAGGNGTSSTKVSLADRILLSTPVLVAQYDWRSDATGSLTGNFATTEGSTTVTGSGTAFTTELYAGDRIVIGGESQIVAAVASDTSLTTVEPWVGTNALGSAAGSYIVGSRMVTASLAGTLHKEAPTSGGSGLTGDLDAVTLKTGLTKSRRVGRFVAGGKEAAANSRKLFYMNGVDRVQVLAGNGATTSNIATPPADWDTTANPVKQPINAIVHKDRMFAFGNLNDPHRLYYSTASSHEDFTSAGAGSLRIASQIGERLYGAATFRGVLFLWKYPKGIFYLDDTDTDYTNWSYRIHSEAVGCAPSPHAVLSLDDDVLFMDPHGHVHQLSAVDTLGGVRDSDLTRELGLHGWVKDNVDTTALEQVVSCWNPEIKTAFFGCRSVGSTTYDNDLLLRFDYGLVGRGGPVRFSYSTLYRANALCLKRRDHTGVPALMIGETSTSYFVDPTAYGYRTIYGVNTGFAHEVRTASLDFADQDPTMRGTRKTFQALELVQRATDLSAQSVTVTVRVDNVVRQTFTATFSERRRQYGLNVGDGYEIDISITSDGTSTADIGLLGGIIYYQPCGQDQSRAS